MWISSDEMKKLAEDSFGYRGRKYQVIKGEEYHPSNYWSGGSKTDYRLILREGLKVLTPPSINPMVDKVNKHPIPPGCFVVEHVISCGKDLGIRFIVRPDEWDTGLLSAQEDLSFDEKVVLVYTRSRKSSYAGIKNYRLHEAMRDGLINEEKWETAKQALIEKKLLNKSGAITDAGKNQVEGVYEYHLKEEV